MLIRKRKYIKHKNRNKNQDISAIKFSCPIKDIISSPALYKCSLGSAMCP